jgi:hypothetical protein
MTRKYPHDDDWGDWALEARRAKELDRRWAEEFERAFAQTFSDDTQTCQRCGAKGRPPCPCSTPDSPTEHPDTGWRML